jgi:hypothetical protein
MPLATAAKTFGVPRNTLRARLVSGSISNRQIGKGATLSHLDIFNDMFSCSVALGISLSE